MSRLKNIGLISSVYVPKYNVSKCGNWMFWKNFSSSNHCLAGRRHYSLGLFSRQPSCVQHLATNVKPFLISFVTASMNHFIGWPAPSLLHIYLFFTAPHVRGSDLHVGLQDIWELQSSDFRTRVRERRKRVVQLSGISMIHSLLGSERSCPLCTGSGTNNHWGKEIKVVLKEQELLESWSWQFFCCNIFIFHQDQTARGGTAEVEVGWK